ncbi:MAG: DUF5667 domain-containing protein [Actinomycetota bacterium]|nr:DUF5667 domain-containing protein [Actinomycetota bacterium]
MITDDPDDLELDDDIVIELLSGLVPVTAPDGAARDRIRERVLAGFAEQAPAPPLSESIGQPRPVRAPRAGRAPQSRRPGSRPGDKPTAGWGTRGRLAVATVAALALVFSLTGMSLLLARDALPGDALYGMKRTAEAASLGLTFGDEEKAFKHLEFATARLTEIETLAGAYPNPNDAPVDAYLSALTDFDVDATAGSRELIALTTASDGSRLTGLGVWAEQQFTRLEALRLHDAARTHQAVSVTLLGKIQTRASALAERLPCEQITSGDRDDIGALPASSPCAPVPRAPAAIVPPNTQAGTAPVITTGPVPPPAPGSPRPPTQTAPVFPGTPAPPVEPTPRPTDEPGAVLTSPTTPGDVVPAPLPLPPLEVPPLLPGLVPGLNVG